MPDTQSGLTPWVEPRSQTPTGNALNVQIGPGDPISNIPVVMDFEHHQVHEGETRGRAAEHWAYDHGDPHPLYERRMPYSLDPSHYQPMCMDCHRVFDIRMGNRRGSA